MDATGHNRPQGALVMKRADALALFSAEPDRLTRPFLTASHRAALETVRSWFEATGAATGVDALGTVVGRIEGERPGLPALILASHIDSVRDAGRYDGILGVLCALAVLETFPAGTLPFAIEAHAYGDEEGLRFPATLSSSRAITGRFDPATLDRPDADGVTLRDAIRAFGRDPARIAESTRRPEDVLAYFEVHIEQGPVLEAAGQPLGIVTAISGASRFLLTLAGEAGHAGTVPMALRRDALTGAAEIVLAVERIARGTPEIVATVGRLTPEPGAVNVIPGAVAMTLDLRSPSDGARQAAVADVSAVAHAIAEARRLTLTMAATDSYPASACDPALMELASEAIRSVGGEPLRLPSGAGHDALSFAGFCPVGMMFVRCKGGVSHNPAELITLEDADIAVRALVAFVERMAARLSTRGVERDDAIHA